MSEDEEWVGAPDHTNLFCLSSQMLAWLLKTLWQSCWCSTDWPTNIVFAMPASDGKCSKEHGQKGRDSPGESERDWEITVQRAADTPGPILFLLFIVRCCVPAVINVWLFVESHPECWHTKTPRSMSSAHGVTPQLLMHTSRWTQHNRIAQVIMWLAACWRAVIASPLSITAPSGDALCLDLPVLTEMCVDIYLVEGRESRRAQYTLQCAKCGGDGGSS